MVQTLTPAAAGMTRLERVLASAFAESMGHTRETLTNDPDAFTAFRRAAVTAAKHLAKERVEDVGDVLFDAAHDNCDDDGCTGGGAAWYQRVAARLVDPHSAVAAIAMQQQMRADEGGNPDLDNLERLGAVAEYVKRVRRAEGVESLRQLLVGLGGEVADWVEALDRQETEVLAATVEEGGR